MITLTSHVARKRDHGGVIFINLANDSHTVAFREPALLGRASRLKVGTRVTVQGDVEDGEVNATALWVLP